MILVWIGYFILVIIGIALGIVAFLFFGWLLALAMLFIGFVMADPLISLGGIVIGIIWVATAAGLGTFD